MIILIFHAVSGIALSRYLKTGLYAREADRYCKGSIRRINRRVKNVQSLSNMM